jgi:hypothetical protein
VVPAIGSAASVIASKIEHSCGVREYTARARVFPGRAPMQTALLRVLDRLPRKKRKKLSRKGYTFSRTGAGTKAGFVP